MLLLKTFEFHLIRKKFKDFLNSELEKKIIKVSHYLENYRYE